MQPSDHFIVLAIGNTFNDENPSIEMLQFRSFILNLLKQSFLNDCKNYSDAEKVIYFLIKQNETAEKLIFNENQ